MAQFEVTKKNCSYGTRGDVVELSTDKLTDRQKTMLRPYKAPAVKKLEVATPKAGSGDGKGGAK